LSYAIKFLIEDVDRPHYLCDWPVVKIRMDVVCEKKRVDTIDYPNLVDVLFDQVLLDISLAYDYYVIHQVFGEVDLPIAQETDVPSNFA